jgi:glycosyltransferase involved in cell wall biosynthesis
VKVLVHCVYFSPEVGGLESHVYYLCRALVGMGHQVEVVTSSSLPGVPEYEEMEGIRVWRTWFPSRSPLGWIAHSLGSIPMLARRAATGVDILHAQAFASIPPCVSVAPLAGRRIPVVATFHTSHFLTRAEHALWRPVLGELVRAPDYSLAASQEIATVAEGLAPGTRVEALTNGVETDLFRRVEPAFPEGVGPRIIVPRRLFPKNAVEYFIRAMPAILREIPAVEALLVGDGPDGERLRALAGELGISNSVRFLGARPHGEMPGLLSSADLAVFPSLMEATSVAALECMACEVPVAASRVGGLPEIVDDRVGGLFEPADPGDLARRVVELLGRKDLRGLGEEARRRVVEHWSNARLARRHLEIYEDLAQGPSVRPPGSPRT